jgi:rsbT co-antagonist protein RsbR
MNMAARRSIASTLLKRCADIQAAWAKQPAVAIGSSGKGRISAEEMNLQIRGFLDVFSAAVKSDRLDDINVSEWTEVRSFLDDLSRRRVLAGFSSDETATFIFSLKRPVFDVLRGSMCVAACN